MSPAESPESKVESTTAAPTSEPWIYVRHIGRNKITRTRRKLRAGRRRQGAVLDNGARIRKKGRYRLTRVGLREFMYNHEQLFFYLDNHIIEVVEPKTMNVVPRDELLEMLEELAKEYGKEVKVGEDILPPALLAGRTQQQTPPTRPSDVTKTDLDAAAMMAAADQAEVNKTGEANLPPSEREELVEEGEEESLTEADLKKMSRKELDGLAREIGIDPKEFSNKDELVEALLEGEE